MYKKVLWREVGSGSSGSSGSGGENENNAETEQEADTSKTSPTALTAPGGDCGDVSKFLKTVYPPPPSISSPTYPFKVEGEGYTFKVGDPHQTTTSTIEVSSASSTSTKKTVYVRELTLQLHSLHYINSVQVVFGGDRARTSMEDDTKSSGCVGRDCVDAFDIRYSREGVRDVEEEGGKISAQGLNYTEVSKRVRYKCRESVMGGRCEEGINQNSKT